MSEIKIGKIVQITVSPSWLWALDENGTIWRKHVGLVLPSEAGKWYREQGPIIGDISNVDLK